MKVIERLGKLGNKVMYLRMENYFCVCENCGSISWEDINGDSNELEEDGNMLEEKDIWDLTFNTDEERLVLYCHDCEKPVEPIQFTRVSKKDRKKVYKMDDEERIKWIKSFRILDELEKHNEL